jgi:XTP/dITP diphosphohydrolase
MHRRLTEPRLLVASHNKGKVFEIRFLVAPYGIETVSAAELGLAEPEETGVSYAANARLKAEAAARASGLPALADDSGLSVEALGGAPGIYSARWAGESRDFGPAMRKVEAALQAVGAVTPEQRRARFVAALCLAWPDGHVEEFLGEVAGTLVSPPRGDLGFGYDPMFLPDGHDRTFGEMDGEEKHGLVGHAALSHRARAFLAFARACLEGRGGA